MKVHNNNVVLSWNVMRASAELGIARVAIASTVNVGRFVFSTGPKPHYFPLDEDHPCEPDEPYGLSKVIAELQADTIVRRFPGTRIASLRLHWAIQTREFAMREDASWRSTDLWGYVQQDSAAEAFLLAVTVPDPTNRSANDVSGTTSSSPGSDAESGSEETVLEEFMVVETGTGFSGHERFYIVSPRLAVDLDKTTPSQLVERFYGHVPVKEGKDLDALGLVDCSKAKRMLGWVHRDYVPEKEDAVESAVAAVPTSQGYLWTLAKFIMTKLFRISS